MEAYLKITYLNDFIFCPLSIYYHELYGTYCTEYYYTQKQLDGKAVHEAIDEKRYSTHKNILQAIDVYSDKYKLCGKIDLFDIDKGLLTERKKHIQIIYDGYVFQLYAQYFSLTEMGYKVKSMRFYSSDDNRVYPIELPQNDPEMLIKFEKTVSDLQNFNPAIFQPQNESKCLNCIYRNFCDRPLGDADND